MQQVLPLSFISAFSFGHGCVLPTAMGEFLKNKNINHLPLTDLATTAGLPEAINVCNASGMDLLYGQTIIHSGGKLLMYPNDKEGFSWLNKFCSELLKKIAADKKNVNFIDKIFSDSLLLRILNKFPPEGNGRIIICNSQNNSIFELFESCYWQIFYKVPENLSVTEHEESRQICRHYDFKPILAPTMKLFDSQQSKTMQLLTAIKRGKLLTEIKPEASFDKFLIPDPDTEFILQALKNNKKFVKQKSWFPHTDKYEMPCYTDSKTKSTKLLKEVALRGLKKRYKTINRKIKNRFEFELEIINELDFTDYFLIVNDITSKAKELGVRVLGRGSAANSIVSYALDFTQVDPIEHNLYFERFLNQGRKSPPDIDLDFSWKIRDQMYKYLQNKWGAQKVALISTHITFNSRAAIRESGKTMGTTQADLDYLTNLVGRQNLKRFCQNPVEYSRFKPDKARLKELWPILKLAAQIEGLPSHFSLHAGGLVIALDSLYNYTITQPSSKVLPLTHIEMRGCEKFGLVKLDLLSQRALGVYADVSREIEAQNNQKIPSFEQICSDKQLKEKLKNGRTMGVFYIESPGMRGLLSKLKCESFTGLVAASSIIRPGVAESGMMKEYINRHRAIKSWKPDHPLMGKILKETYGIMVYQEDVMKVAHITAGFSLTEADMLRRAMSGKERSFELMKKSKHKFIAGALKNKIPEKTANEIWRQISSFCGYAFCKAHSASYAVLSMQLLWMKIYYPAEFFSAVLNNRGGFYSQQAYTSEAKRNGLKLYPPDINCSRADCIPFKDGILIGLSFIGKLKSKTIEKITEIREKKLFTNVEQFIKSIKPDKSEWENLLRSGCLNEFGSPAASRWQEKLSSNEASLFNNFEILPLKCFKAPDRKERIKNEILSMGFSVSGHPTELLPEKNKLKPKIFRNFANQNVTITGLLIAVKSVTTSDDRKMKFITLEDVNSLYEIVVFPHYWEKSKVNLNNALFVKITGRIKNDNGTWVIHGHKIEIPSTAWLKAT
ncbi:MAG: DNA polymerase III subunit alpha [Candidatus Rifleibacteriota bacterium]